MDLAAVGISDRGETIEPWIGREDKNSRYISIYSAIREERVSAG